MICYVLVMETQSAHGYIDTSLLGAYSTAAAADVACSEERKKAQDAGERLADEAGNEGIWTVGLKVEEHEVQRIALVAARSRWHRDAQGNPTYAVDLLGPIVAQEIKLLDWQKKGLRYTATGYGSAIPTSRIVYFREKNGTISRPRRIYATQYSNVGTCWITVRGKRAIVRESDCSW